MSQNTTPVQARIKGLDEYTWLTYNGAPLNISFKNNPFTVHRGDIFGVRKGTGDTKRVVFARPDLGLTRVLTMKPDLERILSKSFSKLAPTLKQVEHALTEEELPLPSKPKVVVFEYYYLRENTKPQLYRSVVSPADAAKEEKRLKSMPQVKDVVRVE